VALSPTGAATPTDPSAPPAFRPCDWVTTHEASDILDKPVTATPGGDQSGSVDVKCFYATPGGQPGVGVSSELLLPGAFPVDAETMFAKAAAEDSAAIVGGFGVNAVCVFEPQTTPPSTTFLVLLNDGRIYRATSAYEYCDTVERFAQTAIDRIAT
jgi:hypothetical protein